MFGVVGFWDGRFRDLRLYVGAPKTQCSNYLLSLRLEVAFGCGL